MSRPYDWYPLASTDPVPGDPDVVHSVGIAYREVAQAILDARANLLAIADMDGMTSEAVEEIGTKAKEIAEEISKVRTRYQETGDALIEYQVALRGAQADADDALVRARAAHEASETQRRTQAIYLEQDPSSAPHAQMRADEAEYAAQVAEGRLATAASDLADAVRRRGAAAARAPAAVSNVNAPGGVKDGGGGCRGADMMQAISDVASIVAAVAGVLALVLAWVPGLGAALAAVALIAGAVALVADVFLASHGDAGWGNVVMGVLGLVTFGVGRVVGTSLKVGSRGVQAAARVRADQVFRAASGPAGVRLGARRLLNDLGMSRWGMRATQRVAGEVAAARSLRQVASEALSLRAIGRDTLSELQGFRQFRSLNWSTFREAVVEVPGAQGKFLALVGFGAEGRGLASVGLADPSLLRNVVPAGATPATASALVSSYDELQSAIRYGGVAANFTIGNAATAAGNTMVSSVKLVDDKVMTPTPGAPQSVLNLN